MRGRVLDRRGAGRAVAWLVVGVALQAVSVGPAVAQGPDGPQVVANGQLGERLDGYVRSLVPFGFSGQVLVARDGEVLLDGAYGWADRGRRVPMTRETRLGIASASKQLTAAALLHLAASGAVSLDDTLDRFFPAAPADKGGITLRQVLTHTAGLRGGVSDDFDTPTLEATVDRLLAAPLTFQPGSRWGYASDGYNLIAAVIQRVTGEPYQAYARRALFEPAGMARTGFWREADAGPDVARSYVGWRDRGTPAEWPVNWRVLGAGDVVSTAGDLYRWHRALADGRVLDPDTRALYFTPQVQLPWGGHYGFGLFHGASERGGPVIEHGGDTELGFNASFFRYPEAGVVIIVVSNSRDPDGVSARHLLGAPLEQLVFGDDPATVPPAGPLDASALSALAGSYPLDGGGSLHLINDGALLWAAGAGQPAIDLLAPGEAPGEAADSAAARTRALLDRLRAGDMDGYRDALAPDGLEYLDGYVGEWRELTDALGPVHRFEIVGSARVDDAIIVYVRLHFRSDTRTMTFRWLDLARGRLSGTNIDAPDFPWAFPVGRSPDGGLVVWDPLRDRLVMRLEVREDGGLRVVDVEGGTVVDTDVVRRVVWEPTRAADG